MEAGGGEGGLDVADAAAHAYEGAAAAAREGVVMLGAVLDATSSSAMQQLSLAMYTRPLATVGKGVRGATASLAAALTSGRCPKQPAQGAACACRPLPPRDCPVELATGPDHLELIRVACLCR